MTPNWFIALPVPAEAWVEALTPVPPGARRFHASDVHVTVAFLGGVGEERAQAAWEVALALPQRGPFSFRPGRIKPFGGRRPSAWSVVPADDAPDLTAFIADVRGAMSEAAGVPADRRQVKPHATLARPGRQATYEVTDAIDAWAETQRLPEEPVTLERIALYTWSALRGENLFRVVAERAL